MKRSGLSQEGLKVFACVTMLLDHIGAMLLPGIGLRLVGRLAYPVYCFLLAEGAFYTRNRRAYGRRLLIGMLLSEIPYDLLFFGQLTWAHQSVMVTLMLGYLYALAMNRVSQEGYRLLLLLPFALAAELLGSDYGGWGVALIGMFVITREKTGKIWLQALWLLILSWMIGGMELSLGPVAVPIQVFSVAALIPISLYDGHKHTNSLWVQRGFYLFYPVHLLVLFIIRQLWK